MVQSDPSEQPFYLRTEPMERLTELNAPGRFVTVPDDWYAIVTDVIGSTTAISEGRYKDVNLVGASVIPAVIDGLGQDCPYIFNGDGALMLIPPGSEARAQELLGGVVYLARENFDLRLRAAIYPVGELRSVGYELEMGRLRLVGEQTLAQFRGTMVTQFDERIRCDEQSWIAASSTAAESLSLNSLSCRWHAQPSRNGEVLSILLLAKEQKREALEAFLKLLSDLTGGQLSQLNPVAISLSSYQSLWQAVKSEKRLHAKLWSKTFLRRLVSICISVPLFKWGLSKRYDWAELYLKNLSLHSDFHKLDEALRLVIDCTPEQSKRVQEYLREEYAAQRLNYGVHCSTASQMTCYVESLNDAAHVHFIDGCDGGYVAAAVQLKQQLSVDEENSRNALAVEFKAE